LEIDVNARDRANQEEVNENDYIANEEDHKHESVEKGGVWVLGTIVRVTVIESVAHEKPNNQKPIHYDE